MCLVYLLLFLWAWRVTCYLILTLTLSLWAWRMTRYPIWKLGCSHCVSLTDPGCLRRQQHWAAQSHCWGDCGRSQCCAEWELGVYTHMASMLELYYGECTVTQCLLLAHLKWVWWQGNIVGLSTSGIPISATVLSFAPHPKKADLHGGTFGPEQSLLAPVAYIVGCVILVVLYGTERYPGDISAGFSAMSAHAASPKF